MPLRRRLVAPVLALAINASLAAGPFLTPVLGADCGSEATSIVNGGFEDPGAPPADVVLLPEAAVSGWRTTDAFGEIELWGDGFLGVPAAEGTTYAELNANSAGTLYQDIATTPGATMTWTLQHHAREGVDVMRVLIGDAATADVLTDDGWNQVSGDLSDGTDAWGTHSDSYVVPEGQTCTRFAFRAVSSGAGSDSYGNLLDAITFDITIPAPPTPRPTSVAAPTTAALTPPPTDTLDEAAASREGIPLATVSVIMLATALVALSTVRGPRRRDPTDPGPGIRGS